MRMLRIMITIIMTIVELNMIMTITTAAMTVLILMMRGASRGEFRRGESTEGLWKA